MAINLSLFQHLGVKTCERFSTSGYQVTDLRGRAHRYQVEQVPVEQRCPQRRGALRRPQGGWLLPMAAPKVPRRVRVRLSRKRNEAGGKLGKGHRGNAGFDVFLSRNVETYVKSRQPLTRIWKVYKLSNH